MRLSRRFEKGLFGLSAFLTFACGAPKRVLEPCKSTHDCASGLTCVAYDDCTSTDTQKRCRAPAEQGGVCKENGCAPGLECWLVDSVCGTKRCLKTAKKGEVCGGWTRCEPETTCYGAPAPTPTCQVISSTPGAYCGPQYPACEPGLTCNGSFDPPVCWPPVEKMGGCSEDANCQSGLTCKACASCSPERHACWGVASWGEFCCDQCSAGLVCVPPTNGPGCSECLKPVKLDEQCDCPCQCEDGMACNVTHTPPVCRPVSEPGAQCGTIYDKPCDPAFVCVAARCSPP